MSINDFMRFHADVQDTVEIILTEQGDDLESMTILVSVNSEGSDMPRLIFCHHGIFNPLTYERLAVNVFRQCVERLVVNTSHDLPIEERYFNAYHTLLSLIVNDGLHCDRDRR